MNNESPLVLISKQLLTVYKATTRWSREGKEGRKEKWKKERELKEMVEKWSREAHAV